MNAEIISIGTEILLGETTDTNSTFIARQLRDIGINLFFVTAVGDNLGRITASLRYGLQRSDLIITTGGLGPTVDDMTRQAVANATDRELVFQQHLFDHIAERFRQFGVTMTENNRQQAHIPADAIIIENPVGTAPCYIVEAEHGIVISLPGVPREMKYLMEKFVIPYLREKFGQTAIIKAKILRTAGIGESALDDKIGALMTSANPTVGLAAHSGQTDIRITARADSEAEADAMIATMEKAVRERTNDYIFGEPGDSLDETVFALLAEKSIDLALCEAGTSGVIASRLSDYLKQAPENHATVANLRQAENLPADADLKTVAETTAARLRSDTQLSMVVLFEDETAGLAVGLPDKIYARVLGNLGELSEIENWAGNWGLGYIWQRIKT